MTEPTTTTTSDPRPVSALEQTLYEVRLRSIYENGLCQQWLKECDAERPTWDQFLALIDEQVEMDAQEHSSEFQSLIREAITHPPVRTLKP